MPQDTKFITELRTFEQGFDTSYEDRAVTVRGEFLRAFPLNQLKKITVDDYVIGKGTASFCAYVEPKTKAWANVQGATSKKFGIYFGRIKSDPTRRYRFINKFGSSKNEAFGGVKTALLDLVRDGRVKNFQGVDENPLSQMFKAKILSLYFPEIYLNICSSNHLEEIASKLGISKQRFASEYQHLLLQQKFRNAVTRKWSNPKYMSFLYDKYIYEDLNPTSTAFKKPRKKVRRRVNFEDIAKNRGIIGRASEEFALQWEKNRLSGLGYIDLASQIDDRRDIPSYGYDFLSYSTPDLERYIEVKSVGKNRIERGFRFYLSDNEHSVSISTEYGGKYYFYLVFYDNDGKPYDLLAKQARELYSSCDLNPCAYLVRFELEEHDE